MSRLHLFPTETPAPISGGLSRKIHPGLALKAQNILKRIDRRIGHARTGRPDQAPVDIPSVYGQVIAYMLAFRFAEFRPPTARRIVVVSTGIGDRIRAVVVRQIGISAAIVAISKPIGY